MKTLTFFLNILFLAPTLWAQDGNFIHYELTTSTDDPDSEMAVSLMNGSTMTIVSDANYTYVKTNVGAFSTTEVSTDIAKDTMIMFMSGMMGNMAFAGSLDSLKDDSDTITKKIEYTNETKMILGYNCKKAIVAEDDGSESIFWYTAKIKLPNDVEAMPNGLPGICLEMTSKQENITMTYVAVEIKTNINATDYKIVIPDNVEVMTFFELYNMGQ